MFRRLLEGGGICGAIFRAAGLHALVLLKTFQSYRLLFFHNAFEGSELLSCACRDIGHCDEGCVTFNLWPSYRLVPSLPLHRNAVVTPAFALPSKSIVHGVGPIGLKPKLLAR